MREGMKRCLVLGTLLMIGALSLTVAGLQAPPPGPTPAALTATKIEKVKDNLYVITGSGASDQAAFSGGNTAVFITDDSGLRHVRAQRDERKEDGRSSGDGVQGSREVQGLCRYGQSTVRKRSGQSSDGL
jgi:hypothetical protein